MGSEKINLDTASKEQLRALCKEHGVKSYSKLTNDGMRAAVRALIETDPNYQTTGPKKVEPAPEPVVTTLAPVKLSGVTKAQREERNGVKRPREGGLCRAVWDSLDQLCAGGVDPSTKDVRDLATAKGWNQNNATAELSGWRKFNGISRSVLKAPAKPKGAAKGAPPATGTDSGAEQPAA